MRIATGSDAATLLAPLFAASSEERVAVLHLDSKQEVLALTLEHRGTDEEVELPVRAILSHALRLGSQAIIVAHNHPSGDPSPSKEDLAGTRRLAEAAAPLGIRLFDHLIFAGGDCRSFRALGLL